MAVLKKYDLAGKEVGEVSIDDQLIQASANLQMIKDYLVALRANKRQWSANTKGRSEVNHTGKKPHPQKGTGRARQGCLAAPQYKGGGRVHAPKPKMDQHVRINKKEKRAAIRHLLAEKIAENKLHILQYKPLEAPKTKQVANYLRSRNLSKSRILFLGEGAIEGQKGEMASSHANKYDTFIKSMRNIQKIEFMLVPNISGHDVALTHEVIIMEPALDELIVLLGGKS